MLPLKLDTSKLGDSALIKTRIYLRVPPSYHQEPIICQLIAKHGLTVNISAASLGQDGRVDGWFSLDLIGTDSQIRSALVYLRELDLELWQAADASEDW